jgi:hypothetical protein
MNKLRLFLAAAILLPALTGWSQTAFDLSREAVIDRLKQDVYTLASDEMEGRESGTASERLAADYIKKRMQEIGLKPLFGDSFLQAFPFPGEWVWGEGNTMRLGQRVFQHDEDFFTLPGSANVQIQAGFADVGLGLEGIPGYEGYDGLADLEGRLFIMEYFVPEEVETALGMNARELLPHRLELAAEKGAAGILFVNARSDRDDPRLDLRLVREPLDIPLVFLRAGTYEALVAGAGQPLALSTDLTREEQTGLNVAGYLDNGAAATVVIGGHFDHVGYGNRGSRSPGERAIHYGADDNASGTAGVLEAARYLSQSDLTAHNYIFIGFGAEEKGLIGSRYFTNSGAYDMEKINYMFNFDMIGRLEDYSLSLIGTGTSPAWEPLIDRLAPEHFNIRKSPGGTGGSDHTNFYQKDIPVIFFFTGTHEDYHRPGDTPDKVNYEGAREILELAYAMMAELDGQDRLAFSTTPVVARGRSRTDAPTLGLMPDHGYDGDGLRVQAVIENRPAHQAGMKDGDVIIRINDTEVLEIETYMEALGKLQRGAVSTVVVKRGEEELQFEVQL